LKNPVTTQPYRLSLHDALPICLRPNAVRRDRGTPRPDVLLPLRGLVPHPRPPAASIRGGPPPRAAAARTPCSARAAPSSPRSSRSEEHTSELQSPYDLVCRLLL